MDGNIVCGEKIRVGNGSWAKPGRKSYPELDSQKSAMNAAGSDSMPELALRSGGPGSSRDSRDGVARDRGDRRRRSRSRSPRSRSRSHQTTTNPQQEPVAKETFTIKRGQKVRGLALSLTVRVRAVPLVAARAGEIP
ncbi:hypothetical protein OS493_040575 [Desmophyllum pertusum]|uniref:Uncharacterized protein n=1 Tax=Desmophyllum pertusum TaxID=174260 RepID=A0A9X0CIK3_9CNID|nr:hypothetical protein OS493_040575 [Desmophyllum pertusum]